MKNEWKGGIGDRLLKNNTKSNLRIRMENIVGMNEHEE
jgi:hypothetical protein